MRLQTLVPEEIPYNLQVLGTRRSFSADASIRADPI